MMKESSRLPERACLNMVSVSCRSKEPGSPGFTLLETAIVIVVAGVLIAGVLAVVLPFVEKARLLQTNEKLAKIGDALNIYALNNFRLPCPAQPRRVPTGGEPFGFEQGSGATGAATPRACPFLGTGGIEGIVPFATIGLGEDMVRDAWGNYFTYAVSDAFARDTAGLRAAGAVPEPEMIHPQCRTREWMYGSGYDASGNTLLRNRSPRKARFCCPGLVSSGSAFRADITVNDEDGSSVLPPDADGRQRNPGPDGYRAVDTLMEPAVLDAPNNPARCTGSTIDFGMVGYFTAPQVPPACARATAVAYILVSHGPDGRGIYNIQTGNRLAMPAPVNIQDENADGDTVFRDQFSRQDVAGANRSDDLVLWRTQDLIFAAQGESCSLP